MYNKNSKIPQLSLPKNCTGCLLCVHICPAHAITIIEGKLGEVDVDIDNQKCIRCNKCVDNCPNIHGLNRYSPRKLYAAVSQNSENILQASSGGAFFDLASLFIENNGVVYGVVSSPNNEYVIQISYKRAEDKNQLVLFQGSKYVQSDINDVYSNIKEDIKENRPILFTGTPCQVAAIRRFSKNYNKLYTVDIICHGVPSQRLFTDYLTYIQNKYNCIINSFSFRNKRRGWGMTACLNIKKFNHSFDLLVDCRASSFYSFFLDGLTYRESCYHCQYASRERIGDITLGDFWGVQNCKKIKNEMKEKGVDFSTGVSCIFANTDKGEELIIRSHLLLFKSTFEDVAKENRQLVSPTSWNSDRKKLIELYERNGYEGIEVHYKKTYGIKRLLYILKPYVPMWIRKLIVSKRKKQNL